MLANDMAVVILQRGLRSLKLPTEGRCRTAIARALVDLHALAGGLKQQQLLSGRPQRLRYVASIHQPLRVSRDGKRRGDGDHPRQRRRGISATDIVHASMLVPSGYTTEVKVSGCQAALPVGPTEN